MRGLPWDEHVARWAVMLLFLAGLLGACSGSTAQGGAGNEGGGGQGGTTSSSTTSSSSTWTDWLQLCEPYQPVGVYPSLEWDWQGSAAKPCTESCTVQQVDPPSPVWCDGLHALAVTDDVSGEPAEICSRVPGLVWSVAPGDAVTVAFETHYNDNDWDDAQLTVTRGGQIVLFEAHAVAYPIQYPSGVDVTVLEPFCEVPPEEGYCDCMGLYRHPAEVTVAGSTATVLPGETKTVGGFFVLLGQNQDGSGKNLSTLECGCDPYSEDAFDFAVYPVPPP